MPEVGSASLAIIPSFNGFQAKLEGGTTKALGAAGVKGGTAFGDSAGKAASGKFSQRMKQLGKVAALGLAGAAVGAAKFAADSVQAASDLEESTNKLRQVFGVGAEDIEKFAGKAAVSMGQTNLEARNAAATFGIFGKVAKLTEKQNVKFATQMTTLASDLASFHNTSPEEAIEALGSALRGEAEPIRKYGILLDEATLKAEALAAGIIKPVVDHAKVKQLRVDMIQQQIEYNEAVAEFGPKSLEAREAQADLEYLHGRLEKTMEGSIGTLTQEQKVLAARLAIMKQSSDAQGDFARTSDGLANQQRILKARWEDSKIALGEALLPAINDAVKFLNEKGIPAFERFSDWFVDVGIPAIKRAKDPLKAAVGYAKDLSGFLGKLPNEAKVAGLVALVTGVAGVKLRGGNLGGGGALGTAGKVLGLAKPVPVLVMNKGFGPGTVPGAPGKPGFPPVVAAPPKKTLPGHLSKLKGLAPLVPAAGALGNDQLPDLMTDKQVKDFERYQANIERSTDFWLHHNERIRNGTIPLVDAVHQKFEDLFGVVDKVDKKDPKVTVALPGYSAINAFFDKLEGDLEWVTRPRYIRIGLTRDFDTKDGRAMMPGLQERAGGGHMKAGTPYLVGERGPEVFTPYAAGRMTANHQGAPSGGGDIVFDFRGSVIQPRDYDDFMSDMNKRRDRAALEGRR